MKRQFLIILAMLGTLSSAFAGEKGGNGAMPYSLQGFEDYKAESATMRTAITQALKLIKSLDLKDVPELSDITNEIEFSNYILVKQDVAVQPNRAPGDYPVGGFLVASTDLFRGAPTRIYPKLVGSLTNTQLQQMVIHEALHRTLPEPVNGYEEIVERMTNILTQYTAATAPSTLRSYLDKVHNRKLPWVVQIDRSDLDMYRSGSLCLDVYQKSLQPLYDDGTIVKSSSDWKQNVGRIKIWFELLCSGGTIYDFQIAIYDSYRALQYTFVASSEDRGTNRGMLSEHATKFIRDTIAKIESDLQLQ